MTSAMRKYNYLKVKGQWGAKFPDNKKIVAMLAQLNALKGQLKLDKKLGKLVNKKKEGGGKKKNKKNTSNKVNQKRTKLGRRCLSRTAKRRPRTWENTLTTGASTICPGPSTHQLNAALASSTRGRAEQAQAVNYNLCQFRHLCRGCHHASQPSLSGHARCPGK